MNTDKVMIQPQFIFPNPDQPRKAFDTEPIRELAESILNNGLIQPIAVVRLFDVQDTINRRERLPEDIKTLVNPSAHHMIIAGERRWRAACLIAAEDPAYQVPALVHTGLTDQQVFELSLVENVNRQDMLPMEEAAAFGRLRDEYGVSVLDIAAKVGRSPDFVRGRLALLSLDPDIQALVNGNYIPLTVAVSISRLSSDRQHQVIKAMNEQGLNAMEACFLADQMYGDREQGTMFDLGQYMQDLAAQKAAEWLAKAKSTTEKVKEALSTAITQLALPDLQALSGDVQARIALLTAPAPVPACVDGLHCGPGDWPLCPGCEYFDSYDDEVACLSRAPDKNGKACFTQRLLTLAELVEDETAKEADVFRLIGSRKGMSVTDQVAVFVVKAETGHKALTALGIEDEKDHHLQVVVQRRGDTLLTLTVAERPGGTADIYVDTDFGVGEPRWESINFYLERNHRYYEDRCLGGGTLLYREDTADG